MSSSANTAKKRLKTPSPSQNSSPLKKAKSTARRASPDVESESNSSGDESSSESSSAAGATAEDPTTLYQPPPSFTVISKLHSASKNPFSPENLAGKHLWLIEAPTSVPLSNLRVISPADIADGTPVLETGSGKRYAVEERQDLKDGVQVVLPVKGAEYRLGGKEIAACFQVVETLPVVTGTGKEKLGEGKPVREQPEGLKMRFKPLGYEGVDGEDSILVVPEPGVDVVVNNQSGDKELKKKKKRKHQLIEDGAEPLKEKKHKSKKHKTRRDLEA